MREHRIEDLCDKIIDANATDAAQQLLDAIGAKPGDSIEIVTPQFTRPASMPPAPALPATDDDWVALSAASPQSLQERGFGSWDGGLFLFPGEWYGHIPGFVEVECISGERGRWDAEERDDDVRFGCLAYGVRIGPSTDGEA